VETEGGKWAQRVGLQVTINLINDCYLFLKLRKMGATFGNSYVQRIKNSTAHMLRLDNRYAA